MEPRFQRPMPPPPPPQTIEPIETYPQQPPPIIDGSGPFFDQPNIRGISPGSATSVRNRPSSVNENSGGFHYKGPNNSFISAFSKMDNDKRKEFRPWMDSRRRPEMEEMRGMEDTLRPPLMPMPPGFMQDRFYDESLEYDDIFFDY